MKLREIEIRMIFVLDSHQLSDNVKLLQNQSLVWYEAALHNEDRRWPFHSGMNRIRSGYVVLVMTIYLHTWFIFCIILLYLSFHDSKDYMPPIWEERTIIMTNRHPQSRIFFVILITTVLLAWSGWTTPAHAQAQVTGYSIKLTYTGPTTIALGDSTSTFYAYFTYTNKPSNGEFVALFVDNGVSNTGSPYPLSSTEDQYYFASVSGLTTGQHQLQAKYYLTTNSTWIVSNIIIITVGKGYSNTNCGIENFAYTYLPGKNMTIHLNVYQTAGSGPVDWQNGTFTIGFSGPSSVTYSNLKADSNEQVIVLTPHTTGQYQVNCTFNGSPNYAGSSYSVAALVSEQHQTGAIQLYTNPTTVVANQITTYYVVIPAGNGLPTPTGTFNFYIGNSTSTTIHINASGATLVKLNGPTSVYGKITLHYSGDGVYISESPTFPLTNSAIPASSGTTPTPKPTATATASPSPTVVPGAVASPTIGATVVGQSGISRSASKSSSPNVLLMVLLFLLAIAAVAGGGVLLIRRRAV